jgi:F-type H+-transporting ATPase subunit gamma
MPSLKNIRTQIASKKSTQKITRAMKLVAASRLRRAQDAIVAARPYANALGEAIAEVALRAGPESHPLLDRRAPERITLVLLTSDRGLAGGFNANLLKLASRFAEEHSSEELVFEIVGKKARDFFRRRNRKISGEHIDLFRNFSYGDAERIATGVIERYAKAEVDAVYLFVNEFRNVVAPNLTHRRILPIEVPKSQTIADYIYEQKPEELLGSLLPRYVKLQIYRALLESSAAEHAARMTAMDAASSNANDVIDRLTLYMNRVRQASITKEIIEVVSGAAAAAE